MKHDPRIYYMYLSPAGDVWSLTPTYSHLQHTEEVIECNMANQFEETEDRILHRNLETDSPYFVMRIPIETFYLKQASLFGTLVNCYVHSKLNNPEGMQRIVDYFENIYKKVLRGTYINSKELNLFIEFREAPTENSDAIPKSYND